MTRNKLFDLHIEIGMESSYHYAKCIFGNNVLEVEQQHFNIDDAIYMLLADMHANQIFNSLKRDPSLSVYPIPNSSTYNHTGQVGPAHTHGNNGMTAVRFKMFELHFEVGENVNAQSFYAKTELQGIPHPYEISVATEMSIAVSDLVLEMEQQGVIFQIMNSPTLPVYPFPSSYSSSPSSGAISSSSSSSTTSESPAKKKDIKRKLPSECIGYADIECRDYCTSWDIFGAVKCGNMCEWRKKI